tara:strand:+ start:315 stop:806 length:492 start_codon:yes stop_codon:yes gene_type:complete
LLNTTVASIALTVNHVLTTTYAAIYGVDDPSVETEELNLLVAPLTAITELQGLYTAGLVDFETAIPVALHSLGSTAEEITAALERRREQDTKDKEMKSVEDKTTKAELQAREKLAKHPELAAPAAGGASSSSSGSSSAQSGGSKTSSAARPSSSAPSSPGKNS